MQILFLSKRQYTGKDLLDDQYGRLYRIPQNFRVRGHQASGLVLSYRSRSEGEYLLEGMVWRSLNLTSPITYFRTLGQLVATSRPDLVIASSDAFHAILAWQICSRRNIPFIIDFYDNYEGFGMSRLPSVVPLLRKACRSATGVTVVGHELKHLVESEYRLTCPIQIVPNAISKKEFIPQSKVIARKTLGLPLEAKLIGTAGAISAGRGIEVMFEAFLHIAEKDENVWLVFAGPRDATPFRYRHERIMDLGVIDYAKVPLLLSALDVGIICNIESSFGRYCFPQKFYEMVACGIPIVAADVGEMRHLLANQPDRLYQPGNSLMLADRIRAQLHNPTLVQTHVPDWDDVAGIMEKFASSLLK